MSIFFRRKVSMLEGSIIPRIIAFALPLMLSNLLQILFSHRDMQVVALADIMGAVSAIGSTSLLINCVLAVFVGFSIGANVVTARYIGAREDDKVSHAVHTALLAAVIFGVLGGAVGFFVAQPSMAMMGVEGQSLKMAAEYCRIRFIGTPFLALTNFCVAISLAKADSKTPLIVLGFSGLLNEGLNRLFLLKLNMGVGGVAWATNIASVFSAVLMLIIFAREEEPYRFSLRKLRIDSHLLREVLQIGVPAGLQSALILLSNTIITSSIIQVNNTICPVGSAVLDGNSAAASIENLVSTCCNALALSFVSFTSQHCGANMHARLKAFIRNAYLCCAVFAFVSSWLIYLLRIRLLSKYIYDPAAFEAANVRLRFLLIMYLFAALMNCGEHILRGMGRSVAATTITLALCYLLRVVWIYTVFAHYKTLESIYLSYPISWLLAAVGQFITVTIAYRRVSRTPAPEPAPAGSP